MVALRDNCDAIKELIHTGNLKYASSIHGHYSQNMKGYNLSDERKYSDYYLNVFQLVWKMKISGKVLNVNVHNGSGPFIHVISMKDLVSCVSYEEKEDSPKKNKQPSLFIAEQRYGEFS